MLKTIIKNDKIYKKSPSKKTPEIIFPGPGTYNYLFTTKEKGFSFNKENKLFYTKENRPGPSDYHLNMEIKENGVKFAQNIRKFDYINHSFSPGVCTYSPNKNQSTKNVFYYFYLFKLKRFYSEKAQGN